MFRNKLMLIVALYALALAGGIYLAGAHKLKPQLIERELQRLSQWSGSTQSFLSEQLDSSPSTAYQLVSNARDSMGAYAIFVTEIDGSLAVKRDSAEVPKPLALDPARLAALAAGADAALAPVATANGDLLAFTARLEDRRGQHPRAIEIVMPSDLLEAPLAQARLQLALTVGLATLLAAGGVALILGWQVLMPVHHISRQLKKSVEAEGADLLIEFPKAGSAEIRDLAASLETFFERTRDLAATVRAQSYQLKERVGGLRQSLEQTHEASQLLEAAVHHVAASAGEGTTRIEDANLLVAESRDRMRTAQSRAEQAARVAELGSTAAVSAGLMARAVLERWDAMDQALAKGRQNAGYLAQAGAGIGDAAKLIQGVAGRIRQSFSGAVSAASSAGGGHGLGTVTLDLAGVLEEANRASVEVGQLVAKMQKEVVLSAESLKLGQETATAARNELNRMLSSLDQIVGAASETEAETCSIAALAQEQLDRIERIGNDMGGIADGAAESAAFSEEVAAHTHEHARAVESMRSIFADLGSMSDTLTEKAAHFRFG